MKSRSKYNVIDLFSGCGGLIEGFEVTGNYETVAAIDWDKASCLNLSNRMRDRWGYAKAEDIVKQI